MDTTLVKFANETLNTTYRNQFILGPFIPEPFELWAQRTIGCALSIATHPNLGLTQVERGGRQVTCVGFMLDPRNPGWTDEDILTALIDGDATREAILEQTAFLGGRWILIVADGQDVWLVNDALGHRQVFFTGPHAGHETWCASNPRVLADILDIEMDQAAAGYIRDMLASNPANPLAQRGRWWPGIGSPYPNIRHLTPNHFLDLHARQQHRFWPNRPVAPRTLDSAAEEGAVLLRNMLLSAGNRFDEMSLMITRGWDSRLMLAASRDIAHRLRFISLDYPRGASTDVTVPRELLGKLGLKHESAIAGFKASEEFQRIYERNTIMPNDYYAANAEALAPHFDRRRLAITGIATGVFCGHYKLPSFAKPFIKKLTGEIVTKLLPEMENHPYAVQAFEEWLGTHGEMYNHDIFDLFLSEQRTGNWHSEYQLGYDYMWKDGLAPVNCRYLYEVFLGVDKPLRVKPPAILHQRLMRILWPDVLDLEQRKPPSLRNRAKELVSNLQKDLSLSADVLRSKS